MDFQLVRLMKLTIIPPVIQNCSTQFPHKINIGFVRANFPNISDVGARTDLGAIFDDGEEKMLTWC